MKRTIRKVFKKPDNSSKLVLREVIGLTATDCNGLASGDSSSSRCVYLAGCVVVIYDAESGQQSHLLASHRPPRPLSCVAVSDDGRFIAAGESGTQPAVLVWDCVSLTLVSELKGHLYRVGCIAFSPDGKHLVSVGGYMFLWEWRSGTLLTKLKASSSSAAIASVSFSPDAKFVVTAGKKHLKFWAIGSSPKTRLNKGAVSLAMHGKAVDFEVQNGSSFVSIAGSPISGQDGEMFSLYALTEEGVLYLIRSCLSLRKSVDLKVEKGFALSVSNNLVACACSNGIVQLFTIETLKHAGTLLCTKDKKGNGKNGVVSHANDVENDFQLLPSLPDAVACQFTMSQKLVVIYGDHSLYIWNIHDVKQATRCRVLLSHSACIWDIKNLCCDNMHDHSLACIAKGCSGGVSFATCSADGTMRLWDLSLQPDSSVNLVDHHSSDLQSMSTASLVSTGTFERDSVELGFSAQGFRSMAVSPDGKFLAAGDSNGGLHIYDLHNFDYTYFKDAHDSEILSLSFGLSGKNCDDSEKINSGHYFLASGGHDQLINLYDVKRNFDLIQRIDDHSAPVTSVKLSPSGCKILSCGADRSLVFRDASVKNDTFQILHRLHQTASQGIVYDMDVDHKMEIVVTVGQDKKISTFDIASGKLIRSFKQNKDFGDPIKVTMDPSCSYLVCSYSNKSLCLYDFITGEMITQAVGHSEVITGVIFLPDCKHIISVGGDGCIFVWQLPPLVSSTMQQRIKEKSSPLSPKTLAQPAAWSQILSEEEPQCSYGAGDRSPSKNLVSVGQKETQTRDETREALEFKFSVSRLPRWAQGKITSSKVVSGELGVTSPKELKLQDISPSVADNQGYTVCSLDTPMRQMGSDEACHSSPSTSSGFANGNSAFQAPQGTPTFHMDKRWNSIYTVCFPNSPDMPNVMDINVHVSPQNLLPGRSEIPSNGQHMFGLQSQIKTGHVLDSNFFHKRTDQRGSSNVSECNASDSSDMLDVIEQVDSDRTDHKFHATTNILHTRSEESDLFKKHFGSLSSTHKTEQGNSAKRRRRSGRFTEQRDYVGSCERLLDSPSKYVCGETLKSARETSVDPSLQDPGEEQKPHTFNQDSQNIIQSFCTENKAIEAAEQKQCVLGEAEVKQKISACCEALLALDAAAGTVVQLFSDLNTSSFGEATSSEHGTRLYMEAARLLPIVLDKVDAVAKLVIERH